MNTHYCPKCGFKWESKEKATTVCPECQAERELHLAYINALYPSADELGLAGPDCDPRNIPYERIVRPHSSGRRIVRKSEPMAG